MEKLTESGSLIPKNGGFRKLKSFQIAQLSYDVTVRFCDRYVEKRSRTHDQMVQAARSGKQNIVEGCMASGTSKETEIKLINVARASLEELLEDYRDSLRTGNHKLWEKNSNEALFVRKLAYESHESHESHESYETYKKFIETRPVETVANILICLINQCNYLLDRQIKKLEQDFLKIGGLREAMYNARLKYKKNIDN